MNLSPDGVPNDLPYDVAAVVAEVAGAGCCRHPVRLFASQLDRQTGELADRTVVVACKDRRAVLCPACAAVYQADAWQLVAAGLRGGKGVPATVAEHPACFVTLTAPSFGPVHTRRTGHRPTASRASGPGSNSSGAGGSGTSASGAAGVCHRRPGRCPHGVPFGCDRRHHPGDPLLGRPICPGCFDYEGAVLWNASVSLLWQRTSVAIGREIARAGGVPARQLSDTFRLSYLKVVEFQRRGLVHLHVVVRADGPTGPDEPPPPWLGAEVVAQAVGSAVDRVVVPNPLGPAPRGSDPAGGVVRATDRLNVAWGRERAVRVLRDGDPETVAAYVAKYATKTVTDDPVTDEPVTKGSATKGAATKNMALVRRLDGPRSDRWGEPVLAGVDPHLAALARTAWRLGGRRDLAGLNLRAHAHTFGYRGHFATKSRRYSTTFGALRQARTDHARRHAGRDQEAQTVEEAWRYAGRGYGTPAAERLAEVLAEGIAARPRRAPDRPLDGSPAPAQPLSPEGSPGGPQPSELGR